MVGPKKHTKKNKNLRSHRTPFEKNIRTECKLPGCWLFVWSGFLVYSIEKLQCCALSPGSMEDCPPGNDHISHWTGKGKSSSTFPWVGICSFPGEYYQTKIYKNHQPLSTMLLMYIYHTWILWECCVLPPLLWEDFWKNIITYDISESRSILGGFPFQADIYSLYSIPFDEGVDSTSPKIQSTRKG